MRPWDASSSEYAQALRPPCRMMVSLLMTMLRIAALASPRNRQPFGDDGLPSADQPLAGSATLTASVVTPSAL